MEVGVGTIYRVALEGSKTREKVFLNQQAYSLVLAVLTLDSQLFRGVASRSVTERGVPHI
jgi:hypothetical protein